MAKLYFIDAEETSQTSSLLMFNRVVLVKCCGDAFLTTRTVGPLEAVEGHIDYVKYLELLRNVVKPEMDASAAAGRVLVFQQDNAGPHKKDQVLAYLNNWGYEVLNWPPQSPDLSPIENIWNVMKMRLKALRPRPRTKARMRNAMMDIWDELADDIRIKIVGSFRKRLRACIANKGGLVSL